MPDESVRAEPWRLTRERAVYLSVILHLIVLVLALTTDIFKLKPKPEGEKQLDPLGLIALMSAPKKEEPIPVQFFPAPGAATQKPGPRPLPSDKNRMAHGGDPNLPRMETPRAVPLPGIRDLDPGRRGEQGQPQKAAPAPVEKGSPQGEVPTDALSSPVPSLKDRRGNGGASEQPVKKLAGIPQPALASITAEQAARAAKDVGEGDEGGGYERDGGFADSGPLSFDTVGYDWGAYAAEMIRRIKRHWEIPSLASYGLKGRVTIRFFINKNGTVDGEQILASSGKPPFDNAAFQAIARSSAFRPLPADLGHDREGVTVTFFYNMRPEDGGSDEPAPKNPLLPRGRRSGS